MCLDLARKKLLARPRQCMHRKILFPLSALRLCNGLSFVQRGTREFPISLQPPRRCGLVSRYLEVIASSFKCFIFLSLIAFFLGALHTTCKKACG